MDKKQFLKSLSLDELHSFVAAAETEYDHAASPREEAIALLKQRDGTAEIDRRSSVKEATLTNASNLNVSTGKVQITNGILNKKVDIPLHSFTGQLKRHRINENEPLANLIISLAFPHFQGRDTRDDRINRICDKFYGPKGKYYLRSHNPRRRYSGDSLTEKSLPKGRYFSVCSSYPPGYSNDDVQTYNDNGVVCNELLAYANCHAIGPLLLLDAHDRTDRDVLRKAGFLLSEDQKPAFQVVFFHRPGSKGILELLIEDSKNSNNFNWDDWGGGLNMFAVQNPPFSYLDPKTCVVDRASSFYLYYGFENLTMNNVVDLRYPETQEALVRAFFPHLLNAYPGIGAVGGFLKILPSLLSEELGGTITTDIIGAHLRFIGVDALIYPSARCNGGIKMSGGRLMNYHGWNLVDYRGARIDSMPEMPVMSTIPSTSDIQIEAPGLGDTEVYGSWRIRGSTERGAQRLRVEVESYFDV